SSWWSFLCWLVLISTIKFSNKISTASSPPADFSPYTRFDYSSGAGVSAFSARELTLPNSVSVPGYAMVDAQASYDIGRYTLSLSAVNLAGRKVFDTYQYFAFPVVMPVQPRSAYVALNMHF
ncbi:TonB-dependent receptor, partial [Duganella sp. FT50W]